MLSCLEEKRAGLKTGLYCFEAIAQRITDADRWFHRKREEHSQDWLCYRDAGMAQHRDTSRQEAGAKPEALGNYSSRLCLPARIAEWWAIRAEAESTD
jgi:hypothetical protein